MTLEQAITDANRRGLRINNLFQLNDGWQANLTDGTAFYEFGNGPTAFAALADALLKAPEIDEMFG